MAFDPTQMTVVDVVRKLIGPVLPVGDSSVDAQRLGNLNEMLEVVGWLVEDISKVADCSHRQEASMRQSGKVASEFLRDLYGPR